MSRSEIFLKVFQVSGSNHYLCQLFSVSEEIRPTCRYFNICVYLKLWYIQFFSRMEKFEYLHIGWISPLLEIIMYHQIQGASSVFLKDSWKTEKRILSDDHYKNFSENFGSPQNYTDFLNFTLGVLSTMMLGRLDWF